MKYSKCVKWIAVVLAAFLAGGCTGASAAEPVAAQPAWEEAVWKEDFAVSAVCGEESIILSEPYGEEILNEIPVAGKASKLFINMLGGQNGYMLYCSMPESGQMQRIFYATKDRWKTYSEMDISLEIEED